MICSLLFSLSPPKLTKKSIFFKFKYPNKKPRSTTRRDTICWRNQKCILLFWWPSILLSCSGIHAHHVKTVHWQQRMNIIKLFYFEQKAATNRNPSLAWHTTIQIRLLPTQSDVIQAVIIINFECILHHLCIIYIIFIYFYISLNCIVNTSERIVDLSRFS